jgi:hypothetical protein
MGDWLKIFGEMSFDNLFAIAGLAFLAIAAIGKISAKIRPTPTARFLSVFIGGCLLLGGLWIHHSHTNRARYSAVAAPDQTERITPIKEVNAQDGKASIVLGHSAGNIQKPQGLAFFSGSWKNVDRQTRGITHLNVRTSGASVWVRAWGSCHPSDCEWGEVPATAFAPGIDSDPVGNAQKVTAVFETSFSNTRLTLTPSDDDELEADTQTRFTDNSGRSSYSASYTFRH